MGSGADRAMTMLFSERSCAHVARFFPGKAFLCDPRMARGLRIGNQRPIDLDPVAIARLMILSDDLPENADCHAGMARFGMQFENAGRDQRVADGRAGDNANGQHRLPCRQRIRDFERERFAAHG